MVNYVYYLVCLCFGIFGVKYFVYGEYFMESAGVRYLRTSC